MLQFFGITAGILAVIGYIKYTKDIIEGNAKPERGSWLIWFILAVVAFISQLAAGASNSLWFTGLDALGIGLILALSIKYGVGGMSRRDTAALIATVIGLILWCLTRQAGVALFIIIAINSLGICLTVIKSYDSPDTETYFMWAIVAIAGLLTIISVGTPNPILLAYPCYIFLADLAVILAIYMGRLKHAQTVLVPAYSIPQASFITRPEPQPHRAIDGIRFRYHA